MNHKTRIENALWGNLVYSDIFCSFTPGYSCNDFYKIA